MDERTLARFWKKVDKAGPVPPHLPHLGPCWVWTAHLQPNGYPQFGLEGRLVVYAHRFSFRIAHGRWPKPCALHRCDNRACVRPDHLFEGTRLDNMADCARKGRIARGAKLGPRFGEHGTKAKLKNADVLAIREAARSGETQRSLAARYGVSQCTINYAVRRRSWKHI